MCICVTSGFSVISEDSEEIESNTKTSVQLVVFRNKDERQSYCRYLQEYSK